MGSLSLIFKFVVSLSVINIVVWGVPTGNSGSVQKTVLTLSDKTDGEGYHTTCHASKPGYKENFKWQHSMEDCSKPRSLANFHPLPEDKHNKISRSENDEEFQSTLTQVGATGKEDGPKHCVCCEVEIHFSICFNLTMQHEHQHPSGHHHHHHHHH